MSTPSTTLGQLLRAKLDGGDLPPQPPRHNLWKVHGHNVETMLFSRRADALNALTRCEEGQLEEVLLSTPCEYGDTLYTVWVHVPYEDSYEMLFTCPRKMATAIANTSPDYGVEVSTMSIG